MDSISNIFFVLAEKRHADYTLTRIAIIVFHAKNTQRRIRRKGCLQFNERAFAPLREKKLCVVIDFQYRFAQRR